MYGEVVGTFLGFCISTLTNNITLASYNFELYSYSITLITLMLLTMSKGKVEPTFTV